MDSPIPKEQLPSFEVILATLCYLMSRYANSPSLTIASAVSKHFQLLHEHPDCDSPILQDVGRRMSLQWEALSRNDGTGLPRRQTLH